MSWKRMVIREVRKEGCGDGWEREQIMGTKMLMKKEHVKGSKGTEQWGNEGQEERLVKEE